MSDLVTVLRDQRKSPAVLKLKILKIRGQCPDVILFVFEGEDDIPVYEEWLQRIACCPQFESVPGSGKEQLLALLSSLRASNDPLLDRIYFFIDRDFDLPYGDDNHVFELQAYSIENLLCTAGVLESLLRDEFRRSGRIAEREKTLQLFETVKAGFISACYPLHIHLFASRQLGFKVIRKAEKSAEIANIMICSVEPAYKVIDEIVTIENFDESHEAAEGINLNYARLSHNLAHRGKYLLDFFKRWLRLLSDDLRSATPKHFESSYSKAPDMGNVTLRRLASAAPIPLELSNWITARFNAATACSAALRSVP